MISFQSRTEKSKEIYSENNMSNRYIENPFGEIARQSISHVLTIFRKEN
jgi:hypothetical protein